jgi:hypothetical protein
MRIGDRGETNERGLAIFNDKTESFQRLVQFGVHDSMSSACTTGHPVRIIASGIDYYYQGYIPPFLCRMRADLPHVEDLTFMRVFRLWWPERVMKRVQAGWTERPMDTCSTAGSETLNRSAPAKSRNSSPREK